MKRREFLYGSLGVAALLPARSALTWAAVQQGAAVADLPARSLAGDAITLRGADVQDLAAAMRGTVLVPGQAGYDDARRVWNGMFDRRPALIARCAAPSDVMRAVTFAREHRLFTAVRGGGHSMTGKSSCDGGINIDLSPMQAVRVDPQRRIAHVEGGALLRHLDRETKAFGLATTAGTVSHTGAGGLTLGGGFGRLARRFGLACDNVLAVDVVTADGRLLRASASDAKDLYWGVRGGGGNFGVATAFEYRLHPLNPTILGGVIAWPFAQAREVLSYYGELSAKAPDELNLDAFSFWTPEGQLVGLEACWSADHAAGERVLQPLRALGRPAFDQIGPMPYVKLQASGDQNFAVGRRYYNKSGFLPTLSPEAIDALVATMTEAPPRTIGFFMQHSGGAINRTPVGATAFPNRDASQWLMVSTGWQDAARDQAHVGAVRGAWKHLEGFTRGFYVNTLAEEDYARVESNYGPNYARLARLKAKYDPDNLFRLNANVAPRA